MHRGGQCNLGSNGFHDKGNHRWAYLDPARGEWNGFCEAHTEEAMATSGHSHLVKDLAGRASSHATTAAVHLSGAAGIDMLENLEASGGAGTLTAAQRELAIEDMIKQWGLTEAPTYSIGPPPLPPKAAEMSVAEVKSVGQRVITAALKGMPRPQRDGSLSAGEEAWSIAHNGRCFMPILNAAERAKEHEPEGGWDEASMSKAQDEFKIYGNIAIVVPEVKELPLLRLFECKLPSSRELLKSQGTTKLGLRFPVD